MTRIAVVGCGVVGSSWALVFARAGLDVAVWDATPAAVQQTLTFVRESLESLVQQGLGGA
jgi:L-gulonate 3-dehydrogenase